MYGFMQQFYDIEFFFKMIDFFKTLGIGPYSLMHCSQCLCDCYWPKVLLILFPRMKLDKTNEVGCYMFTPLVVTDCLFFLFFF